MQETTGTSGNHMRAVIYSRVSTDRQAYDSQLQEVRAYCVEAGTTRKSLGTPPRAQRLTAGGLAALMRLVRRGKVDVIVCFKLDRLGRSLAHLAQLIAEFRTNRAAFVCTSQGHRY
jgi:DNA invertase Pin-like site-specific DNA recombinase